MPIDFDEAPLIDDRRLHKTVAIPLLDQVRRQTSLSARFSDVEQEGP